MVEVRSQEKRGRRQKTSNAENRANPKTSNADFFSVGSGRRYYNPELGRWVNRDPADEGGGLNLLNFVQNSPLDKWDGHGLAPCGNSSDVGNRGWFWKETKVTINGLSPSSEAVAGLTIPSLLIAAPLMNATDGATAAIESISQIKDALPWVPEDYKMPDAVVPSVKLIQDLRRGQVGVWIKAKCATCVCDKLWGMSWTTAYEWEGEEKWYPCQTPPELDLGLYAPATPNTPVIFLRGQLLYPQYIGECVLDLRDKWVNGP